MEMLLILIVVLLKDDKNLSDKLKPMLKTLLDNKELLEMFLAESENKSEREKKKEEPPPPKETAVNSALKDFLDRYVR